MNASSKPIIVTAPQGLIPFVKNEVIAQGCAVAWTSETALGIKGDFLDAMRLNLWLRTAHHVLYQLAEFNCRDLDGLYRSVNSMPWESVIAANGYISVVATVDHPTIRDHRIVNLKCKDAVVDRIAGYKGRRPDSGSEKRGAVIVVFWNQERCSISIDTSGEPLSKRGYRKIPLSAPMQETLAAGVVAATGFSGKEHFINPMCGSGTLAIEAALCAAGKAPGLTRNNFGFMHTLLYDESAWRTLRDKAEKCIAAPNLPCQIVATDNDARVVDAARQNAVAAGVDNVIEFDVSDFTGTTVPPGSGVVIFNPEYGIRLGDEKELVTTYRAIGTFLKQRCQGYRGFVFTGNSRLAGNIGLKSGRKQKFQSGKIDCRLYEYDLYRSNDR